MTTTPTPRADVRLDERADVRLEERADVRLDVRPVPPKDRFETIMEHYERLDVGETLELTVDHDPECMYYTLLATRGADAFAFDYLESGPETWRVRVARQRHVDVAADV